MEMTFEPPSHRSCGNGMKIISAESGSLTNLNSTHYTVQVGAQFDTKQISTDKILLFMHIDAERVTYSQNLRPQDDYLKDIIMDNFQTYQLSRFLKEPANYRYSIVSSQNESVHVRHAEHMILLEEQVRRLDDKISGTTERRTKMKSMNHK